jgi:hypothetical protein
MVAVIRDEMWRQFYDKTNHKDPRYKRVKETNVWWRENNRPVVPRDAHWQKLYTQTNKTHSEEMRLKEADVLWIVSNNYEKACEERKAQGIKVLTELPSEIYHEKSKFNKSAICQAITMSNKPCQYKSVSECGRFCKKHLIV